VLVAGGSGAIGVAIASHLGSRGYSIAVHYRSGRDRAESVVAGLPGPHPHIAVGVDLLDRGATERAVADAERALEGPLTAVVNSAWPTFASSRISDLEQDDIDAGFAAVRGHLNLCAAVVRSLRKTRGSLVLLGGALAHRRHPSLGLYSLTKAAAESATLTLALEEGRYGIRANVVAPGRVDIGVGDLTESDAAYASLDAIGALRRSLPLPTADEVAHTVAFLIGPESTAITGQVIATAGGEQW
jgi:NAD(P)-dependent dehydrogenase (short-subunit alcohol dehydrogenase family)